MSRGLINYNLLCRQEKKKNTLLEGMYLYSIIFLNIFGGGEITFLPMSKAGCFMFLCKRSGKSKASMLVCHSLSHSISLLYCSGPDLDLKEKVEPLLPAASVSASSPCRLAVCHASCPCAAAQAQPMLSPSRWPWAISVGQTAGASSGGALAWWEAARTSSHPSVHPEGS